MSAVDIKGTKNKVLYLLETESHLRDSDEKLIANIWFGEIKKLEGSHPKEVTGMRVLEILSQGLLTNSESIRRSRAELQRSLPELRGEKYNDRMNYAEVVKDDLDDFNEDLRPER